jgi:ATP-binding cassette subfamily B protein/subfamily B ATP-binding cassette protein MsbA
MPNTLKERNPHQGKKSKYSFMLIAEKKQFNISGAIQTTWQSISSMTLGLLPSWTADTPVARLIRQTAKRQKKLLGFNLSFALLLGVAEASLFGLIYRVLRVLAGAPIPTLFLNIGWTRSSVYIVLLIGVMLLQLIASFSRGMNGILSGYFAARCQTEVVPKIHRFILSLSYGCASQYKIGDLAHIASSAPRAINVEIEQGTQILSDTLLICVYLAILILISPWLMVLAMVLAASMALIQSRLRPRIRRAAKDVEHQQRTISGALTADLQVLRLLHTSAATGRANELFAKRVFGLEVKLRRLSRVKSMLEPVAEMMPMIVVVILGIVSWKISAGDSKRLIPDLATFVLALQRLNVRLIRLGQNTNLISENFAQINQLNEVLETKDKLFRRIGGLQFDTVSQGIAFNDVVFRYPEQDSDSISGVSFSIGRNKSTALVGTSGGGKTTIADLLTGIISPTDGHILVDGRDLQTIDIDSWQQRLGVVSQDVLLINDTIRANLTFGLDNEVSNEEILDAAIAANAHCFINQLPDKFNTLIGENGYRLSGGQRQRLSLARAILRKPEILILDEATSALDSLSEQRVQEAMMTFSRGRTVLTIAHRLSSIVEADEILVISNGRITERGSHNELIALGGHYSKLWRLQAQQEATDP